MQKMKTLIAVIALASCCTVGCRKEASKEPKMTASERQFAKLYSAWRAKHIDVDQPVINSFLPAYTKNPEFKAMEEMGEPAIPMLAARLRKALHSDTEYASSNWCDLCLVYAIVHIKGWDAYATAGVASNQWVSTDDYAQRVLSRLLEEQATNNTTKAR